jgi:hypothetical protein
MLDTTTEAGKKAGTLAVDTAVGGAKRAAEKAVRLSTACLCLRDTHI